MPFDLPKPTDFAIPAFVLLILAEMIYGWRTGRVKYHGLDAFTSMIMGLGSVIAGLVSLGFTASLSYYIFNNFRLFDAGYSILVFILVFILDDLAYYWIHRFGHRMRWMWAAHVIHHSSQHYNLSTALRQTWTGSLTPGLFFKMPLFALGFDPAIVAFCAGLNLVYQFWIHTEAIDKMPRWFEAIFNTPSHHRVHHATNPRYLDANYAGVFIIWDKIFASFVPETKEDPCHYGLVRDIGTFNPLRVAFHEWYGIFRDIIGAKSWRDRLLFLVAPPGWTPDGSRKTSDQIRADWLARQSLSTSPVPTEQPEQAETESQQA